MHSLRAYYDSVANDVVDGSDAPGKAAGQLVGGGDIGLSDLAVTDREKKIQNRAERNR